MNRGQFIVSLLALTAFAGLSFGDRREGVPVARQTHL